MIALTGLIILFALVIKFDGRDWEGKFLPNNTFSKRRYGRGLPRAKHNNFENVVYYSDFHKEEK